MVLLIGGETLPHSGTALADVIASPALQESCTTFLSSSTLCINAQTPALHVFQGELARTSTSSPVCWVGSSDATTCVIVVLLDTQAGLAAVAHFDAATSADPSNFQACLDGMNAPSLYLVGGYGSDNAVSSQTFTRLLQQAHSAPTPVILRLACIGILNTDAAGAPRSQSFAVNLHTGTAVPASFLDRGPLAIPRLAQLWLRERPESRVLQPVFDPASGKWKVSLILGAPNKQLVAYLRYMLAQDTPQLMELISTSPEHEGPGFVEDMRGALQWLLGLEGPRRIETYTFVWGADGWRPSGSMTQANEEQLVTHRMDPQAGDGG